MSTSHLSYDNFTGCLFDALWNSSWPFSCTRLYMVSHRHTSPTTVCWWRKSVDICDWLMHIHALYHGPGPSLVTGVMLWLVRGSGTVYRLHCDTNSIYSLRKQLKTFLYSGGYRTVTFFARYKYSYLLTYLLTLILVHVFFSLLLYGGFATSLHYMSILSCLQLLACV